MRTKSAVIIDLPPEPPAYVEVCQDFSATRSKEIIQALNGGGDRNDPPEPPHTPHEHPEESRVPVITGIRPISGRPGDTITIFGYNFGSAPGKVFIGGVEAPVV